MPVVIDQELYRTSAPYRELADELHRVETERGALHAAYGAAIADAQRLKAEFGRAVDVVRDFVDRLRALLRDDPGRGGSGGSSR